MLMAIRGASDEIDLHIARRDEYVRQHAALVEYLRAWAPKYAGLISRADLMYRGLHITGARYLFQVIQLSKTYDNQFTDTMTDLDIALANDPAFSLCRLEVLSHPFHEPYGSEVCEHIFRREP